LKYGSSKDGNMKDMSNINLGEKYGWNQTTYLVVKKTGSISLQTFMKIRN
jgi:hypothetical protein